jgi:hypothetical protein
MKIKRLIILFSSILIPFWSGEEIGAKELNNLHLLSEENQLVLNSKYASISMEGDSLNVRLVGSWPSGNTNAVALDGDRYIAFVGALGRVYVLDVTDASDPDLLSEIPLSGNDWIEDLFWLDDYLYVVEYWGEVSIVSVADPRNPQVEGYWSSVSGGALSVAVKDTIACFGYDVTGGAGGTEIVSVSDPSNPVLLSTYSDHGTPWQILIRDSLVFVAAENTGLSIFSISDPSNPREVGRIGYAAFGVALNDTIAYITDLEQVRAISIADPSNPTEISSYSTPGRPFGIATAGSMAYVADVIGGFRILSISDPTNLEEVGYYQTIGEAEAVAYSDPYAYVGTDEEGLMVFEYLDPTLIGDEAEERSSFPKTYSLSQNYPNPFNPSTTIQYDIPSGSGSARVEINIYNIHGRLIKKLVDEQKNPGSYTVNWNGRDSTGHRLSSGIYLYRMQIDSDLVSTKKMVLLK